ncbi:MAG: SAM-dependent chlorinase/fluorinase [Vicinamibacterales bacterium]
MIALLTDFGLHDHYVGVMKAVMLGICPGASLIDLTHDVPPQDLLAGAIELEAAMPYLPDRTIVLAVVDPGVGSSRRAIAVDTGRIRLVGPDNGLLSLAVRNEPVVRAVELTHARFHRTQMSRTFEGRDRFAPVAAWLAAGTPFDDLGPAVGNLVMLDVPAPTVSADDVVGEVLRVDRFGNLVTNIASAVLGAFGPSLEILVGDAVIPGIATTYAEVSPGTLCALIGSTDRLEIAVNGNSAASRLGLARGAAVRVRRHSAT